MALSEKELIDIWYRNEAYEINILHNLQLTDEQLENMVRLLEKRDQRMRSRKEAKG